MLKAIEEHTKKVTKPIILKQHFRGEDTIIYGDYIQNGCRFWDMTNKSRTQEILTKHDVHQSQWQEVLDAIKNEEVCDLHEHRFNLSFVWFALKYCRCEGPDPIMRQVIINSRMSELACWYCKTVENDPDVRQVIIDKRSAEWAFHYCDSISNDEDMRQVILDKNQPFWAMLFCTDVKFMQEMRQVILDANDPWWALELCRKFGDDEEAKQIIYNAKDPKWKRAYKEWTKQVEK